MADREDPSNLPPIPDGGLSESMPDWLRRPPAWRTLPDREVVAPEPASTAELPEADDSVIDPRTFLSDNDLPAWLRNLGPGRRAGLAAERDAAAILTGEPEPASVEAESSARASVAERGVAARPARFVPTSPPAQSRSSMSSAPPVTSRSQPRTEPAAASVRQWTGLAAVLAGLLVIAIVVIVILLVA